MKVVEKSKVLGICIRRNVKVYRIKKSGWLVPEGSVTYSPVESTKVVDFKVSASEFKKPVPQEGRDPEMWNRIPLAPVVLPEDNVLLEYDRCNIYRRAVPAGATIVTSSFGCPEEAGVVGVILPPQ